MEKENGTIYIATNLLNGKQYVGQTTRKLETRMLEHHRPGDTILLFRAIQKHKSENFKWISFFCAEEDLDWYESFLIKELNTLAPHGYNIEGGGNINKEITELTRAKMRENHADFSGKNHPQYGTKTSEKTKNKKRQTCLDKYGVLHPMQTEPNRSIMSEIKIKWWGEHPEAKEELVAKNKNSSERLKKHHRDHPELWTEAVEKYKETRKQNPELTKQIRANNPITKLTEAKVSQIKKLFANTSITELAKQFMVSPGTIWKIKNGHIWKDVI